MKREVLHRSTSHEGGEGRAMKGGEKGYLPFHKYGNRLDLAQNRRSKLIIKMQIVPS